MLFSTKPERLLIGTYHKTGTVWMQRVFLNLADALGIRYTGSHLGSDPIKPQAGFYLDEHSVFPASLLAARHRAFRMIRDPRDVVISGAHYHAKSHETWLHQPHEDFGGKTYQQAINSFDSQTDRYVFEMQHVAAETVEQMLQGATALPDFLTVRYETWMTDPTMADFTSTMKQLGFRRKALDQAKETFFQFSLFGESKHVDAHTRSGKVEQWRSVYTRAMADTFLDLHGDALITLGYEKNHDWVLGLT